MTEEEFFNGLALSQALPGVNIKNLAIWIGYRMLGRKGAIAGFLGTIVPPAARYRPARRALFASLTRFDAHASYPRGALPLPLSGSRCPWGSRRHGVFRARRCRLP